MHCLIIGVGNEYRQDDAIGILTAQKLRENDLYNVDVILSNGDGASLMDYFKRYDNVFMVDAAKTGNKPGNLNIFNVSHKSLPKDIFLPSTHQFGITEAIETARVLNTLPKKLIIYTIEGKNFNYGLEISKEVTKASDEVIKKIITEVTM